MNKKILISIILIAVSVGLAVLGYIILPEQVVIQFSAGSSGNSTAPKIIAVLMPMALGVGGAIASIVSKEEERYSKKGLIVSVVGIAVAIFMIAVNAAL